MSAPVPTGGTAGNTASVLDQRPQPWVRRSEPVLSALTTTQPWCKVVCYSPHVLKHDGLYRMWYVGTSSGARARDMALGYAESDDGVVWREHAGNPVLTGEDVQWGKTIQTPFVLFDADERVYKMWFSVLVRLERDAEGGVIDMDQRVGYATSPDGLRWRVHPRDVVACGRSPCVLKTPEGRYRMWLGAPPPGSTSYDAIYGNICELTSMDGITWSRAGGPQIRPSGPIQSSVYPFLLQTAGRYRMWYGGHAAGGVFEIFCATSDDGSRWQTRHNAAAFPSTRDKGDFDGRYTSTPCVLEEEDRYLLYYSARDWGTVYTTPDGNRGRDGAGVYAHIGLAVCPKGDQGKANR